MRNSSSPALARRSSRRRARVEYRLLGARAFAGLGMVTAVRGMDGGGTWLRYENWGFLFSLFVRDERGEV